MTLEEAREVPWAQERPEEGFRMRREIPDHQIILGRKQTHIVSLTLWHERWKKIGPILEK